MDYAKISTETISFLYKSFLSFKNSPLDPSIRVFVEIRVSQINGCVYCQKYHTDEGRKLNVSEKKMGLLDSWQSSDLFSEKEKAALHWAEEVTGLKENLKLKRHLLENYFSEREIVDLTACISIIGALNRIAITLRDEQD